MYSETVFPKASPPARGTRGRNSHQHLISYSRQDPDEDGVNDGSEVLAGQLKTTIRYVIDLNMEPYLEILRRLDAAAAHAVRIASHAERIASKAIEVENITSRHLEEVEDHCYSRVEAIEHTVGDLRTTFQRSIDSIKGLQSQTQAELVVAVQNIPVIQASQRGCVKAVQEIINLLLLILHHLPPYLSPSVTEGICKLDPAILHLADNVSTVPSPDSKADDYDDWGTGERDRTSKPNDSTDLTSILGTLLSHKEELSHLLQPTESPASEIECCLAELERLYMKPVNQAADYYASTGNLEIANAVNGSFQPEYNIYSSGVHQTVSGLYEAEGASSSAEGNARDTLRHTVLMAQRLHSARAALHNSIDPLKHSIEQLADDIKSFEGNAQSMLMDQSEGVYAAAQNIADLLLAQRQCTHLITSLSVILLQVMAHDVNTTTIPANNDERDRSKEGNTVAATEYQLDESDGWATTLKFDPEDGSPDQIQAVGPGFGGQPQDLHCAPCPMPALFVEPDCDTDQHEANTIDNPDSDTDDHNETNVQVTSGTEELCTQSIAEELHIEVDVEYDVNEHSTSNTTKDPVSNVTELQEIRTQISCRPNYQHENGTAKTHYVSDVDIYPLVGQSLPEISLPSESYLVRNLMTTGGQLLRYRDRPQLALKKHFTAFIRVGAFPSLEAFKPMVHLLLKHSIQSREYDFRGLARWMAFQNQPSQAVHQSLPTDYTSLQALGEHWFWWTNYTSLFARWYFLASPRSTQGNQYNVLNIFSADLGQLVIYQITLLSNQALVRLPRYAGIFVDEVSTPFTGSTGVLIRIRLAIFSSRIASSVLFRPGQARKSTIPATWGCWFKRLCLCICLGLVFYCVIKALELEQDIQWTLKHQRNQESRRAYKNSRIRSTFRPT